MKVACLCGGVGAARFLQGLVQVVPPSDVTAIVNTGDDIEINGLMISPDIDIVIYHLAGIVDEERGWGVKGDTFNCLKAMERFGLETWFKLGDMDLATHIFRTMMLRRGLKLSQITDIECRVFGVECRVIPMTDDGVTTIVKVDGRWVHFQDYMVKMACQGIVEGVGFKGIEGAKPAPGVIEALKEADVIIIPPSNPIVSIRPILSLPGVMDVVARAERVVAVSPIVGGRTIKGPADKLMAALGYEVSPKGVADVYKGLIKCMVIDRVDAEYAPQIEQMNIKVGVTDTIMKSLEAKKALASFTLNLALS
ncbi:MAG: 2-phospho-L-lactate transferase [Candidatus Nezhaarchaeota archaeon]|nr:2-phospho-L-lactate transferase [Candidatus Nezhaarchaeota archaeon]MCX8141337.1 2-phospho-L-lactate transferase [Candidatus Nezhaarchaeota archaeon]MDW8049603.1 2-phospho-L-lactate transferase [Nitrososphaerota archaeon]